MFFNIIRAVSLIAENLKLTNYIKIKLFLMNMHTRQEDIAKLPRQVYDHWVQDVSL